MKISSHCCTINNLYTSPHGILLLILLFFFSTSLLQIVDAQPSDSSTSSPDDDYAVEGSKVSPSMALIVIVLVLGFFITGCIAIYIQQCSNNEDPATIITRNGNPIKAEIRGLDKSVIESFPTFLYSDVKELKFGKESLECAVCLNEFEEDETLRLLPKCDHVFHPDCIDAWLLGHTTCPVCRANLVPYPAESVSKEGESSPGYEVEVTVAVPRVMRSHSTGHSLGQLSEDRERFTLRLPDEVRKQLMVAAEPKLKRAISLVALPRVSSSRRGYRSGGDEGSGSSRYARFFARSFKWTTKNNGGVKGDGDASTASKRFFGTVVTPSEGLPQLPV